MIEHKLSQSEKTHYTNLWCRQQGFSSRDLEDINSKVADDLVLLIIIKQDYWQQMDKHNRAVWSGLNSMINKGYPFKEKHLKQIEQIIEQAKLIKLRQLIKAAKIRKLRHQSRENPATNKNDKLIIEG